MADRIWKPDTRKVEKALFLEIVKSPSVTPLDKDGHFIRGTDHYRLPCLTVWLKTVQYSRHWTSVKGTLSLKMHSSVEAVKWKRTPGEAPFHFVPIVKSRSLYFGFPFIKSSDVRTPWGTCTVDVGSVMVREGKGSSWLHWCSRNL